MSAVMTAALVGAEARPVAVEADLTGVQEGFSVVGLPDAAVREARLRVQSAVTASGCRLPRGRKLVNLSPADIRKEGAAYDLPIALAALVMAREIPPRPVVAMGELGLEGSVRPVASAVAAGVVAAAAGVPCVVPRELAAAVAGLTGADTRPVGSLAEAIAVLEGGGPAPVSADEAPDPVDDVPDLAQVRGQAAARRAVEVAAAGGHHLLLTGPPGAGKSLLAACLPGLLPPLAARERLEVALIRAAAGLPPPGRCRPFRAPHHSASEAALLGGGPGAASPGEVSLAHRGVLFLDELGEFPARLLDGLRQPLEQRVVHVARRGASATFPADVQLVAATNPCPCGHLGDRTAACRCSAALVDRYARRLSGPLLDRIDLRVGVTAVPSDELLGPPGEPTAAVRHRVVAARARQAARGSTNAHLDRPALDGLAITPDADALLAQAVGSGALTARGFDRVRRVARTVADLADRDVIEADDVAEALVLRGGR